MKKQLTIEEKQEMLIQALKEGEIENPHKGYAIFGIEREIALPLIKEGILHKDTYRFTGGATLTKKGKEI